MRLEKTNTTLKMTGKELAKGMNIVISEAPGVEMIHYERAR